MWPSSKSAWALYEASGFIGRPVRLIGLGMSGWEEGDAVIEDLFTPREARDRERRLYGALDEMALKFGHRAVSLGVKKGRG